MKPNLHSKRAETLENEFFYRMDQDLIAKLHEKNLLEQEENELIIMTGISDKEVLGELIEVGISPKTLLAFSLFPAIYVAWADGVMELNEQKAILKAAENQGMQKDSTSLHLIENWLKEKPSRKLRLAWEDFIHAMRPNLTSDAFEEMRESVLEIAHNIAESAGGLMGFQSISEAETTALQNLDDVFDDASEEKPHQVE